MTESELKEIEARTNASTEGPWRSAVNYNGNPPRIYYMVGDLDAKDGLARVVDSCDAEFIANARTDVPALIAEVRRLRALIKSKESFYMEDSNAVCPWCERSYHKTDCLAFTPDGEVK